MPQYILPVSSPRTWATLDAFTQGYIEAAFFTECNPDREELEDAETGDIAPDSLAAIIADCTRWQSDNAALLGEAYGRDYEPDQAGRDYWFTRNGHGVGFWDREALEADGLGDRLSAACRYRSVDLYRGDNGLVYFG